MYVRMALPKSLIKEDGSPFSEAEIKAISAELDELDKEHRVGYGQDNAEAIANHAGPKMLIVSGPGTGKSRLFLGRIEIWLKAHKDQTILVTSFVRKLVADLQTDIKNKFRKEDQSRITVWTLHKLARSIVEKHHGNEQRPFRPYFKIIGPWWKDVVWKDVLMLHPDLDPETHPWSEFEKQFHDDSYRDDGGWPSLFKTYMKLTGFYNAANFCDLIVAARIAIEEDKTLNTDALFIVDEYQDFNEAEEKLLQVLTRSARGLLIVGDDDQVLYDTLKSGKADLIRRLYGDRGIVNAMLPFCRRCEFHITKTAQAFISHDREAASIGKIYLPIEKEPSGTPVQVVACAGPSTAIDYISRFIEEHQAEIEQRKKELEAGTQKDAFLLILTPSRGLKFFRPNQEELFELVRRHQRENLLPSRDFYRILDYYSLAKYPPDNFAFRRVLEHEEVDRDTVHKYLDQALTEKKNLSDLGIKDLDSILEKSQRVQKILESDANVEEKLEQLRKEGMPVENPEQLARELTGHKNAAEGLKDLQAQEEEAAELAEREIQQMSAVELLTIVSSKGLTADHVIVVGFDDVNMKRITKNAFFVVLTRARKTLHVLATLKSGGSTAPHDFINALPEAHVTFASYKKSDHTLKKFPDRRSFLSYVSYIQNAFRGGIAKAVVRKPRV
jgi:superfamily I DNA/RNA helicase